MTSSGATPASVVDTYLQLCEDRDLDAASRFLAPGLRMQFPGGATGVEYAALAEMVATPKPYAWVRKHRDRFLVGERNGQDTHVVSLGRLYGERLDGTPFDDVRYVDVFVLRDGLIAEQLVWNDLCEAGVGLERPPRRRRSTAAPAALSSESRPQGAAPIHHQQSAPAPSAPPPPHRPARPNEMRKP